MKHISSVLIFFITLLIGIVSLVHPVKSTPIPASDSEKNITVPVLDVKESLERNETVQSTSTNQDGSRAYVYVAPAVCAPVVVIGAAVYVRNKKGELVLQTVAVEVNTESGTAGQNNSGDDNNNSGDANNNSGYCDSTSWIDQIKKDSARDISTISVSTHKSGPATTHVNMALSSNKTFTVTTINDFATMGNMNTVKYVITFDTFRAISRPTYLPPFFGMPTERRVSEGSLDETASFHSMFKPRQQPNTHVTISHI